MRHLWIAFSVLLLASWLPVFGQATDSCDPQPTIDDSSTGTQGLNFNVLAGNVTFNTFDTSALGCSDIGGPDSVVCFQTQNTCTPTLRLRAPENQTAAMSVVVGAQCTASPVGCDDSGTASNGASVVVSTVQLPAGAPVCAYFAVTGGTNANFQLLTADACGTLPVKIQRFVIEGSDSTQSESPKRN